MLRPPVTGARRFPRAPTTLRRNCSRSSPEWTITSRVPASTSPPGLWLTLRAARIGTDIAVTIEESTPAERLDLFTRASALSRRESELLTHLVSGADAREIASRMFLSEHTVQDHLKSVFAKTQTRSRRAVLARALGT
jgi:DNA-binding CsgD family transcriptional regulator